MATKSELWAQLSYAVKTLDETFKWCGQNTPNFISYLQTLEENYEGGHISQTSSAFNAIKQSLNSICGNNLPLTYLLIELARVGYSGGAKSISEALTEIYDGMIAASETVKNRAWTYGSPTAYGSNVGTGILYRLTTNKNNQTIETGAYPGGNILAKIETDKNTGASSGAEQLNLQGSGLKATDNIYLGTSPSILASIYAKKATDGLLANSDFAAYTDDGTDVTIDSWTAANTTKATYLTVDTANIFRTNGITAKFLDNNSLLQYFTNFQKNIPVFLIVRYYRYASCDGTLTVRLGSKTTNVTLSSVADTTWLDVVIGASGSDGWYDNFKEDSSNSGVRVQISLASRTTGSLGLGEIILAQPNIYDGKYYLLTAGRTDFLRGDYFTITDSVANTGRIQTTLARLFNFQFPHTSGAPTYADA